jgi:hypothetical protein
MTLSAMLYLDLDATIRENGRDWRPLNARTSSKLRMDLPPSAADAMICTFECTFCRDCIENRLKGRVPQLRGQFCAAPGAAAASAGEQPAVDAARFQSGRLQALEHDPEKHAPDVIRGSCSNKRPAEDAM